MFTVWIFKLAKIHAADLRAASRGSSIENSFFPPPPSPPIPPLPSPDPTVPSALGPWAESLRGLPRGFPWRNIVFSLAKQRALLPLERLEVMGIPAFSLEPDLIERYPFTRNLEEIIGDPVVESLMGNAMHAAAVGAVVLLTLGNIAPLPIEEAA